MHTVVIIEDNDVVRMTLRALLRHAGYQVVGEAGRGESGIELVRSRRPDVVCLDVQLPGMNGVHVLRELRTHWPTLPVVIVSGYTDRETVTELIECGADAVVVKPFTEARLVDAIRRAMNARRVATVRDR